MTKYEMLEFEVCQSVDQPCIPDEYDPKSGKVWVYAIARVTTYAGTRSLAIVKNNLRGTPSILRVFDEMGVARFDSIHPFRHLDMTSLPKGGKDTYKSFIMRKYRVSAAKVDELTKEQIRLLVLEQLMYEQTESDRQWRKYDEDVRKKREYNDIQSRNIPVDDEGEYIIEDKPQTNETGSDE